MKGPYPDGYVGVQVLGVLGEDARVCGHWEAALRLHDVAGDDAHVAHTLLTAALAGHHEALNILKEVRQPRLLDVQMGACLSWVVRVGGHVLCECSCGNRAAPVPPTSRTPTPATPCPPPPPCPLPPPPPCSSPRV